MERKTIVIATARMNPPTIGHELLVNEVYSVAARYSAQAAIYISRTQDKDNPLSITKKMEYLRKFFPFANLHALTDDIPSIGALLANIAGMYSDLIVVTGDDRVKTYTDMMKRSNQEHFKFTTWNIVSVGKRDSDAFDRVPSASGTKMRDLAREGNLKEFMSYLPSRATAEDGIALFEDLRAALINTGASIKDSELAQKAKD